MLELASITFLAKTKKTVPADVIISRSGQMDALTYLVPLEHDPSINVGQLVKVPLRGRLVNGVVWEKPSRQQLKRQISLLPVHKIIDPELGLLEYQKTLAKWMSDQFIAPLADCVFCFFPVTTKPPRESSNLDQLNPGSGRKNLNPEQEQAIEDIKKSSRPILLHGVTGSGKTEIYLQLAEDQLKTGQDVLILVPEIALTPQTKKRFIDRFGSIVCVWHSDLSTAERRQTYWEIRQGRKRLIVGSRSALFLPFTNLGLIIIDEEHEKSYYQESSPRYHSRAVATKLAEITSAKLVLGSATPAVESAYLATSGQYSLTKLTKRINNAPLPESTIIDLKIHRPTTGSTLLTESLVARLEETLAQKRQAVLLLNRRGSASAAWCSDCGFILLCRHCSVPLTIHRLTSSYAFELRCHHCDHREPLALTCPVCHSPSLSPKGFGTEKVEQELAYLFPRAKILRMDRDTTETRATIDQMYHDFAAHQHDILIGTQMIAKGWDIPTVDLVGILLAESGLMLPDYTAAERTFNLIVQASGRSGRGQQAGQTIIQTYQPDHPLIHAAARHHYREFIQTELTTRRDYHYPPFATLIRFLYQHREEDLCRAECLNLVKKLRHLSLSACEIQGPAPCFFSRLRGKFRYHLLTKVWSTDSLNEVKSIAKTLSRPWVVEVNPESVL